MFNLLQWDICSLQCHSGTDFPVNKTFTQTAHEFFSSENTQMTYCLGNNTEWYPRGLCDFDVGCAGAQMCNLQIYVHISSRWQTEHIVFSLLCFEPETEKKAVVTLLMLNLHNIKLWVMGAGRFRQRLLDVPGNMFVKLAATMFVTFSHYREN